MSADSRIIPAGETGAMIGAGAEGATAPETLRQKDRWGVGALESGGSDSAHRRV
jgi:hypothetical protein